MKDIGNGWVEGRARELLGLTGAEAAYVEAKAALTRAVRERRLALGLSQTRMAKRWAQAREEEARDERRPEVPRLRAKNDE